jgi:hypothetical protein
MFMENAAAEPTRREERASFMMLKERNARRVDYV